MTEKKNKDFMRLLDCSLRSSTRFHSGLPDGIAFGSRIKSENDRKEEEGRSMVEVLGVLAVVGVLSIGSIVGYRYAMDKHGANDVLDGVSKRAVIVAAQLAAGRTVSIAEFEQYKETAGGTIESVEVFLDNSFGFTVTNVKGAVCELIIEAVEDSPILIMADDGETLTEMSKADCDPENPNHFMIVYEIGDGIKCNPEKALSCMDESGNGWCCGAGLICDTANKGCKNGGGACMYNFEQQVQTVSANCHYTIRDYVIEGSLHGVEMTQIQGCPSGEYCLLGYFDDECSSSINRGDVGLTAPEQVYGVCLKRTMNGGTCDVVEIAEGSLTEVQGCPVGQYCYLKWQGSDCSTAINKGDITGPMFGACLERTSTNAQCPIK